MKPDCFGAADDPFIAQREGIFGRNSCEVNPLKAQAEYVKMILNPKNIHEATGTMIITYPDLTKGSPRPFTAKRIYP